MFAELFFSATLDYGEEEGALAVGVGFVFGEFDKFVFAALGPADGAFDGLLLAFEGIVYVGAVV